QILHCCDAHEDAQVLDVHQRFLAGLSQGVRRGRPQQFRCAGPAKSLAGWPQPQWRKPTHGVMETITSRLPPTATRYSRRTPISPTLVLKVILSLGKPGLALPAARNAQACLGRNTHAQTA